MNEVNSLVLDGDRQHVAGRMDSTGHQGFRALATALRQVWGHGHFDQIQWPTCINHST
jgi:hypothetical protein